MSVSWMADRIEEVAHGCYEFFIKLHRQYRQRTIYNVYKEGVVGKKRALLSYLPHSFYYHEDDEEFLAAENFWMCREIGNSLRGLGYIVDVCFCLRESFRLRHSYDLMFETGFNLDRIRKHLSASCLKVVFNTGNHWTFQNRAEFDRLGAIKSRRDVVLQPRRMAQPSMMHLFADALILPGNAFTQHTFPYVTCPVYLIDLCSYDRPTLEKQGCPDAREHFLWLGSSGAALKGLDLVLEAFNQMAGRCLHVVGPVDKEEDFFEVYRKELTQTPNIRFHGYLNQSSAEFRQIAQACCAIVYPSASDGQAGAVVSSMHYGLIPIVSREIGLNVGDEGYVLAECSVNSIKDIVERIASMSSEAIESKCRGARERAVKYHSRGAFSRRIHKILCDITR